MIDLMNYKLGKIHTLLVTVLPQSVQRLSLFNLIK